MKLSTATIIGTHHTNHCEDFCIHRDIGASRLLIAVMDGCTMGTESHFASTLIGKILRKIAHQEYYREYGSKEVLDLDKLLEKVMIQLHAELKRVTETLSLTKYELLSTIVLGIIDHREREAQFMVIGDGVVIVDSQLHDFDQDNNPD
ncbi:MAG: protein phosphatase 2C domain-containing protein, partial [Bacteroidota bacterium]